MDKGFFEAMGINRGQAMLHGIPEQGSINLGILLGKKIAGGPAADSISPEEFVQMVVQIAADEAARRKAASATASPEAVEEFKKVEAEFTEVDKNFFMRNERHNLVPRLMGHMFAAKDCDELIGLITYAIRAILKAAEFLARLDKLEPELKKDVNLAEKADELTFHLISFRNIVDEMLDDMFDAFGDVTGIKDEDEGEEPDRDDCGGCCGFCGSCEGCCGTEADDEDGDENEAAYEEGCNDGYRDGQIAAAQLPAEPKATEQKPAANDAAIEELARTLATIFGGGLANPKG